MCQKIDKLREHLSAASDLIEPAAREARFEAESASPHRKAEFLWLARLLENGGTHTLDRLLYVLNYQRKNRIEGRLCRNDMGRYYLLGASEFTCGTAIEIYVDNPNNEDYGWNFGQVEHSMGFGGYYFSNKSGQANHCLEEGMLVATRL